MRGEFTARIQVPIEPDVKAQCEAAAQMDGCDSVAAWFRALAYRRIGELKGPDLRKDALGNPMP